MAKIEPKPDYYHFIDHSFKPKILVPYCAISHNVDYMLCKPKKVRLSKKVKAEIMLSREVSICEPEIELFIHNTYGMSTWDFIKRWHKKYPYMVSLSFVLIELKEVKEDEK